MKIATSYFFQVRNFKKNMIPLSTAVYDPSWYHNGTGNQLYTFRDKRGIYNGYRIEPFVPGEQTHGFCHGGCIETPDDCAFLRKYAEQLEEIDFDLLMERLRLAEGAFKRLDSIHDEIIFVFIVHEAPTKRCSERRVIQEYFAKHGIVAEELKYPIKNSY